MSNSEGPDGKHNGLFVVRWHVYVVFGGIVGKKEPEVPLRCNIVPSGLSKMRHKPSFETKQTELTKLTKPLVFFTSTLAYLHGAQARSQGFAQGRGHAKPE